MANATGYRIGFAVGDPDRIAALTKAKEEMDSGPPLPCQRALAALLDSYDGVTPPLDILKSRQNYQNRKQRLTVAMNQLDLSVFESSATFYVWARVGEDEMTFINQALGHGIILTPGSAFGSNGKGWIRASVTEPDDIIDSAVQILTKM